MALNCTQTVEKYATSQDDQKDEKTSQYSKSDHPVEEKIDYEPYDHGKEVHPTIFWGPVLHLIKTAVGTGILIVPYTFKSVGYVIAIGGSILIAFIYVHLLHMLLEVEYQLSKKMKTPNLTYVGVVRHSFQQGPKMLQKYGSIAISMVYFHYVVNKSLSRAIYLIIIGGNFKFIIDHHYDTNTNIVTAISIVVVPLILLSLIRNLKFLVPLSMITNAFIFINLVIILSTPTNYDGSVDLKAVNDTTQIFTFFGIVLRAVHATGMILPLKNDMKHPKRFTSTFGVLNIALTIVFSLHCAFGLLTYYKYGEKLQPNVLHNLPPGQLVSSTVLLLHSYALCVSFTLSAYMSFDTIWTNLFANRNMEFPLGAEYGIRIVLGVFSYLIAVTIPDFEIMVTLGGVIGILMDETLPPMMHMMLLMKAKEKTTRTHFIIFKDIVLILITVFLFIGALISAIRSIVQFYNKV